MRNAELRSRSERLERDNKWFKWLVIAAVVLGTIFSMLSVPVTLATSTRRPSSIASEMIPQVKAKIACSKGKVKEAVYKGPESSEVVGYVSCGNDVKLVSPSYTLIKSGGALYLQPDVTVDWHNFRTHIVFGKTPRDGWLQGKADILPDQRYRVVIVGRPVDRSVCENHGGYERTEAARKNDPLNLFGRFVVCRDGSRIFQR